MKIKTKHGLIASKANDTPQKSESERFLVHQRFWRGSNDKSIRGNISLNLKENPRSPAEVPSGTTAGGATKHDVQGKNPSV